MKLYSKTRKKKVVHFTLAHQKLSARAHRASLIKVKKNIYKERCARGICLVWHQRAELVRTYFVIFMRGPATDIPFIIALSLSLPQSNRSILAHPNLTESTT